MNNKGFTLVEIIIVIGILAIMMTLFSVNMNKDLRNNSSDTTQSMKNEIELAADAYIYMYPESSEAVTLNTSNTVTINISRLKEYGLLGSTYDTEYSKIQVTKDSKGAFDFTLIK